MRRWEQTVKMPPIDSLDYSEPHRTYRACIASEFNLIALSARRIACLVAWAAAVAWCGVARGAEPEEELVPEEKVERLSVHGYADFQFGADSREDSGSFIQNELSLFLRAQSPDEVVRRELPTLMANGAPRAQGTSRNSRPIIAYATLRGSQRRGKSRCRSHSVQASVRCAAIQIGKFRIEARYAEEQRGRFQRVRGGGLLGARHDQTARAFECGRSKLVRPKARMPVVVQAGDRADNG